MKSTSITPDGTVLWSLGPFDINLTLVSTWIVMAVVVVAAWSVTRQLSSSTTVSRRQHLLEVLVEFLQDQIRGVSGQPADRYLAFIGTIFVFVFVSNSLVVLPGYVPPTASLSTATALAGVVFFAVPVYGIASRGVPGYLAGYLRPNPIMLPFNIVAELSRTLALAVRLFGNVMSFSKIVGIVFVIAPLVFPAVLNAFGLLTGVIQAYIFTILAIVYVSAGSSSSDQEASDPAELESMQPEPMQPEPMQEEPTWTNAP